MTNGSQNNEQLRGTVRELVADCERETGVSADQLALLVKQYSDLDISGTGLSEEKKEKLKKEMTEKMKLVSLSQL